MRSTPVTQRLPRIQRLSKITRIDGVPVYVHWSVLVISAVILLNSARQPLLTVIALFCYWGMLLLHETGHMLLARRLNAAVLSIEIYPLHGLCRCENPWSELDYCLIAWGGVLASSQSQFRW